MKRTNPYTALKERLSSLWHQIEYPFTREMCWYANASDQHRSWRLDDIYERTIAAGQLGFDVHIRAENGNLRIFYVKKAPARPWELT